MMRVIMLEKFLYAVTFWPRNFPLCLTQTSIAKQVRVSVKICTLYFFVICGVIRQCVGILCVMAPHMSLVRLAASY